jgi:hypothetical protein
VRRARGASSSGPDRLTAEFRQQLLQKPSLWRTTEVPGPDGGPRFNVKKEGSSEPDFWVQLYRLEF